MTEKGPSCAMHHSLPSTESICKYKCPGCFRRLCSLDCYKNHCTEFQCPGKRDPTKLIPRQDLSLQTLQQDYCFLESVARGLSEQQRPLDASKTKNNSGKHQSDSSLKNTSETKRKAVERACKWRRIRWLQLPSGMSRRNQNNSFFDKKSQCIHWAVDVQVHLADGSKCNYKSKAPIKESESLKNVVAVVLGENHASLNMSKDELPAEDQQSHSSCSFYMQVPKTRNHYRMVKEEKSLQEVVEGETVLEYPVLTVVARSPQNESMVSEWTVMEQSEITPDISLLGKRKIDELIEQNYQSTSSVPKEGKSEELLNALSVMERDSRRVLASIEPSDIAENRNQ